MPKIDKATIDKIHDATNIVDVVSDFVSLKKRGSSYLGLCPFHNERTPSFSVSASRGIFKCFSCGKAGSAISFLMDLENMSYVEALKWLGRKYNIDVEERELTSEEKDKEAEQESMFAVNEFALNHFEHNLHDTEEGRQVGKSYFEERGVSDAMIRRFHLGYAMERSDDLLTTAKAAGFDEKFLLNTGLEVKRDNGTVYDRFKGRVIYPIHSLSGRVVAFGGRTLKKEKTIAKYVNSPESSIYSKSKELYGMYQARNAIAHKKNCILVEGYMDVISMHQAGVENVVASSGTSLTDGQIRMIRRFADSVTLIYDSDPAGIKASLRGINMLVAAGLSLKIVLLPEGDDPDSFAQNHSSSEVERYIAEHSQNLIGFKTDVLLEEAGNDPRARGEVINDILQTIALIPDLVEQSIYLDDFAKKSGVPVATLSAQLKKFIASNIENNYKKRQQDEVRKTIDSVVNEPHKSSDNSPADIGSDITAENTEISPALFRAEEDLIKHVLRSGFMYLCEVYPDKESSDPVPMSVIDYIECELANDNISFSHPMFRFIWEKSLEIRGNEFVSEASEKEKTLEAEKNLKREEGLEQIRKSGMGHADILKSEKALEERLDREFDEEYDLFSSGFVRNMLLRSDDRKVIDTVARLTSEPVVLSRMYPKVDKRAEALRQLPLAINTLKGTLLKEQLNEIAIKLANPQSDDDITSLMIRYRQIKERSIEFDKFNGEIVITPPNT